MSHENHPRAENPFRLTHALGFVLAMPLLCSLLAGCTSDSSTQGDKKPPDGAGQLTPDKNKPDAPGSLDQLDPTQIPKDWQIEGQPKELVALIRGGARSIAFSPNGKLLAIDLKLWNVAGKHPTEWVTLKGHEKQVNAVAFSPDGKTLASGSDDETVRLWDLTSNPPKEKAVLEWFKGEVTAVAWSPDGKTLAVGGGAAFIIPPLPGSPDDPRSNGWVRLWDLSGTKPKERATFPQKHERVSLLAWFLDGKTLAGGNSYNLWLWDVKGDPPRPLATSSEGGGALAISPDGKTLASGWAGRDGVERGLRLWDVTGLQLKLRSRIDGHLTYMVSAAFAPNGKVLATADKNHVFLWDAAGNRLNRWTTLFDRSVSCVAFAPDSRHLAAASDTFCWILRRSP